MRTWFQTMTVRSWCVLLVTLACLSGGCSQLDLKKSFSVPFFDDKDDEVQTPDRVIAVWVDTIKYTQGETPTRGFGGKLMFYHDKEEKPVKVEGDLVIYAFDEDGRKPTDPRPTRKYVFQAEQFKEHLKPDPKMGDTYHFFLPWDNVGGYQKKISMIVRFQPKLGAVVVSEQTKHMLPGKPVPEDLQRAWAEQAAEPEGEVRAASFNSRTGRAPRRRMQSTTIPVSSTFGQQIPVAEVRSRFTPAQRQAWDQATRELPRNPQEPTSQPSAGSQPAISLPQEASSAPQETDRDRSQPGLARWRFPGRRSISEAASDSGSK